MIGIASDLALMGFLLGARLCTHKIENSQHLYKEQDLQLMLVWYFPKPHLLRQ
jgi:hypothetical protein